jgi:Ca2+-binding EF-hand superfamily protein
MNMVVNNLLMDLKTKEIDFDKTFNNKAGYYTDEEFIALLQRIEYHTKSVEELDLLRAAFRDDKQRSKISINKIKQRFNIIDPGYINKRAVKSSTDAKQRLALLPENMRENITRIDNFFKRKDYDIRQVFKQMDKNQDGTISVQEFTRVIMRDYRITGFDLHQLEEVYKALDVNKDNNISIGEFMFYFEGAKRSEEDRRRQMSKDVKDQMKFEISKLFEEFDTGNKGFIVEKDLYQILKASGMYIDRAACQQIIRQHDTNNDGKLSKLEFEVIMMQKMMDELIEDEDSINDLNSMFHQADINKDGYLTIDELDIMFKQYDTNITYEDLVVLMKEIDVDGDGRLDIDEFIALMSMDHSSFKDEKSGNTLMKMKRSGKKPAYDFVKYFKIMPTQFIESFTTRQWKKKKNLPSSVFEPKIDPDTLLYRDLRRDMIPDVKKEAPLLAFQLSFIDATGVPYPKNDPKDKTNDLKIAKREVRVCLYNGRSGQYVGNSAIVAALHEDDTPDKWKFNTWKKVVGPNPIIFTSRDKEIVEIDEVQIIFEFVLICKGGDSTKDISCGFASLPMKEFKGTNRKTKHYLDIKGGSPDTPIDSDPFNYSDNLGVFQKMKRGHIKSRLKIDLRYYDIISDEGQFNICMLPSTCIINKKLLHFLSGYRYYLGKELCKETTDNAGFVVPSGNHVIKTFPFIIDNPDV